MKFSDHIKMALSSFVPRHYRKLTAHTSAKVIQTYFVGLLFILIAMLIVSIPKIIMLPGAFSDQADNFDELSISLNVSTSGPIELSKSPRIVVDLDRENRSEEYALLNNEGITYNKYLWFGEDFISWKSLQSVSENAPIYSKMFTVLAILLIPSVIVTLFLIMLIESLVLGAISWLILLIMTRISKFRISNKQMNKVITFALLPFLAIHIIPLAYVRWLIVPLVLYALLVAAATWLVGENRFEHGA